MKTTSTVKLKEVAKFSQGVQVPIEDQFVDKEEGMVRFVRIVDYTKGGEEPPRFIKNPGGKYQVRKDDVIMIRYGSKTAGHVARGVEGAIANNMFRIEILDESKLNKNYLYWFLAQESTYKQLNSSQSSSTMPAITFGMMGDFQVPVLPISEQEMLGNIFSCYENLIENNNRRIAILEDMAQSLYREWFVKFRYPGHEKTKFIDSPLGKIPEGWEVKLIGDVAEYVNRGISPKYSEESEDVVINQKCIRNFKINLGLARRHIKKVPEEKLAKYGDVLVNSTGVGTLGRVAQVLFDLERVSVDTHVTIVRPSKNVTPEYWGCALEAMQDHFERLGEGATGQTELRRQLINDSVLLMPPIELMNEFSSAVSSSRALIQGLLKRNLNLKDQRDLLLPKLISGQLGI